MEDLAIINPEIADVKYLQDTLYVLGGKWKLPILFAIGQGAKRFNEIKKEIPGISSRKLSQELKNLELNGIIVSKIDPDSNLTKGYQVTQYCHSFRIMVTEMIAWGKSHRVNLWKH